MGKVKNQTGWLHGLIFAHIIIGKDYVGQGCVCTTRVRKRIRQVTFTPDLPDQISYFISLQTLIAILNGATSAADAVRIIRETHERSKNEPAEPA